MVQAAVSAADAGLGGNAVTAVVNVTPVNDEPSVSIQGDLRVDENSGAQSVVGFAFGFLPGGGSDEAGQALSARELAPEILKRL